MLEGSTVPIINFPLGKLTLPWFDRDVTGQLSHFLEQDFKSEKRTAYPSIAEDVRGGKLMGVNMS
jgi:hypothetical protein